MLWRDSMKGQKNRGGKNNLGKKLKICKIEGKKERDGGGFNM